MCFTHTDTGLVAYNAIRYEATEDNEISFVEGDTIYDVDTTVSDDWWQGTVADGTVGLFPGACTREFQNLNNTL